jgi:hypothetical protein
MTFDQEILLFKQIKEILEKLDRIEGRQNIMKLPAAAKYLNIGEAHLRTLCKKGLPGSFPINLESPKKIHYNIDVIEAGRYIKNGPVMPQKRRKRTIIIN